MPFFSSPLKYKNFGLILLCLTLAACLQIQVSLFQGEGYLGLRMNLADFLLPCSGLFVLYSLFTKQTNWPAWHLPKTMLWLGVLTIVLTAALINGYWQTGEWSRWAILNKYIGFFILLAYCGLGGWLTTNFHPTAPLIFLRAFAIIFIVISLGGIALGIAYDYGLHKTSRYAYQLAGFMYNRNAYAFLLAVVTALFCLHHRFPTVLGLKIWPRIFWSVLPFILFYNSSRTAMIAVALILVVAFILNFKTSLRTILPWLLLGTGILCLYMQAHQSSFFREKQVERLIIFYEALRSAENDNPAPSIVGAESITDSALKALAEDGVTDALPVNSSSNVRWRILQDSYALWKTAPIQGVGLGTFLHESFKKQQDTKLMVAVIDSTPIWLAVETGLAGLMAFLCFYSLSLWALSKNLKINRADEQKMFLLLCGISLLLIFGVFSLLHEILYTRFFWFILGLTLACPLNYKRAED